ncbi:hypothetical protein RSSM_02890 [Rhodopirellula sallentina SM41]|uniref:Uncharacterized protein n=1 Tax=Rhodopirellula sallentina SM41 TaxID=1263870 RepID=M5U337_9BACT|nr:hypothetical protein RSSM_02890 [Rhodopirellula sallentina SM41]
MHANDLCGLRRRNSATLIHGRGNETTLNELSSSTHEEEYLNRCGTYRHAVQRRPDQTQHRSGNRECIVNTPSSMRRFTAVPSG